MLKIEKNYTFIPTSLFRDCSLIRPGDFIKKIFKTILMYYKKFKCFSV